MDVRPLDLWNQWAIQILVLLSFTLQIILLFLAGTRRHEASAMPKPILWLAYQLADSTAIYAIGHLSLCTLAHEHQLVPFWAPFLLLHLGGPDNITAYALQDNQLWLRHLQNLVVQVLGAAYVLYKHIIVAGGDTCLRLAAILMFAVGLVKYTERTWALKCGNLDSIRSSLHKKAPAARHHAHYHLDRQNEEIHRAHMLFHVCKRVMVNYPVVETDYSDKRSLGELKKLREEDYKRIWTLMEIELSLMYDILYTKASVIYTWCGYCVRLVSPLLAAASFLLFQVSVRDGYSTVDVAVTYTLLAGAFILETWSLLNAVASTWTETFLCTMRWSWPRYRILHSRAWDGLRRFVKTMKGTSCTNRSERLWSGKMGQYNMLLFCSRHNSACLPFLGRLAAMLGCKERWIKFHYSGTVDISDDLKHTVFSYARKLASKRMMNVLGVIRKDWGKQAMQWKYEDIMYRDFKRKNYFGAEFQEGIIIWHIGTEVLLAESRADAFDAYETQLVEAIRTLSNYMIFLLVERPYMLPGLAQSMLYRRTCQNLAEKWEKDSGCQNRTLCRMLNELFCLRDYPHLAGSHIHIHKLAKILYKAPPKDSPTEPRLSHAHNVAKELLEKGKQKGRRFLLELLRDVWTDFLVYAANRCSRDSHAMKLSTGGELTTIVWLMTDYLRRATYGPGEV